MNRPTVKLVTTIDQVAQKVFFYTMFLAIDSAAQHRRFHLFKNCSSSEESSTCSDLSKQNMTPKIKEIIKWLMSMKIVDVDWNLMIDVRKLKHLQILFEYHLDILHAMKRSLVEIY